jgi:hypothetical protein
MIEKDRPGSAGWAATPLLGQLPGDPGTVPPHIGSSERDQRRPEGREGRPGRPRSSLARILAYAIASGAVVLTAPASKLSGRLSCSCITPPGRTAQGVTQFRRRSSSLEIVVALVSIRG